MKNNTLSSKKEKETQNQPKVYSRYNLRVFYFRLPTVANHRQSAPFPVTPRLLADSLGCRQYHLRFDKTLCLATFTTFPSKVAHRCCHLPPPSWVLTLSPPLDHGFKLSPHYQHHIESHRQQHLFVVHHLNFSRISTEALLTYYAPTKPSQRCNSHRNLMY